MENFLLVFVLVMNGGGVHTSVITSYTSINNCNVASKVLTEQVDSVRWGTFAICVPTESK